mgnify:CR=1 FL=1
MRARLLALSTLVAALLLVVALPVGAQTRGSGLSGVALAYRVEQRMRYLGTVHDQSGTWFGVEGQARLGPVTLRLGGVTGKLAGDTSATNPDRDIRVSAISLGIRPTVWLEVGADVAARRVASPASTVVTRLFGGHLALALPLGVDGLSGNATVVYYPAAGVTGDEKLSLALSGELGFSYLPSRGGLVLRLSYRFERYDFGATALGPARLEQVRTVVAGLGIHFGR